MLSTTARKSLLLVCQKMWASVAFNWDTILHSTCFRLFLVNNDARRNAKRKRHHFYTQFLPNSYSYYGRFAPQLMRSLCLFYTRKPLAQDDRNVLQVLGRPDR